MNTHRHTPMPRVARIFSLILIPFGFVGALTVADRVLQMDANRDGKVDRAEWKGPADGFSRIDRNGDGVIDPDELVPLKELTWNPQEGGRHEPSLSNRQGVVRTNTVQTISTNEGRIVTNLTVVVRTNMPGNSQPPRASQVMTNRVVTISSNALLKTTTNQGGQTVQQVVWVLSTNEAIRITTNQPPKPFFPSFTTTTNRFTVISSNAVLVVRTNAAGMILTNLAFAMRTNETVRITTNGPPPGPGQWAPTITTNLLRTVTSNMTVVAGSNGTRTNWTFTTNNRFFVTTNLAGAPLLTTNVSYFTVTNRVPVVLSNTNGMAVFTNWLLVLRTNAIVTVSTNWGRFDRPPQYLRIPEGVEVRRDVNYRGSTNIPQFLDWARPMDRDGLLPAIIYIPGGGWSKADRANALSRVVHWATNGFFVAVVGFRQSQQAKWPAQMVDLKTAIRYVRAKAPELGVHPDRIAVWGTSSGGHLAAMLGATGGVSNFDARDYGAVSSKVQAVVDWSGPSDLNRIAEGPSTMDHLDANAPETRLLGASITNRRDLASNASPVNWVRPGAPPFLIIHSSSDPTVPAQQATLLEEALKKAGVPVELHLVGGDAHAHFKTREPDEWTLNFLRKTLLPKE